ncbi:putative bifunctional diguanylate cyclase/phosphodiesterase [Vitreimonas flagellata]|uniref:putative bifunctional diguanylate cyclase/phosphodiesterase n=1 Tax=Vitreimonas flagellata TaxID=2560861 RepID=UPI0010752B4D|nr:EAL domain-containing protein [Vitreimonas flagellata]
MFTRLSTKLTFLYAGLFGLAMLAIAGLVHTMVSENAARVVRDELQANAAVFDRLWDLRARQLGDSADILARDFGFREAVATRDAPTIHSALENLAGRLQIDHAFMMTLDGDLIGLDGASDAELDTLWTSLDSAERASGVLMLNGRPYQAVSAPILAPNLVGWIVFAAELDEAQLQSFEALAPIPLKAAVLTRDADDAWRTGDTALVRSDIDALDTILTSQAPSPSRIRLSGGEVLALPARLAAFDGGDGAVLVLRYEIALAMRPYQPLLAAIVAMGLLGVVALAFATWLLARNITRPISALADAARALQHGERTEVRIETADEIGRLAQSFNTMSSEIELRQARITHMAMHDSDTDLPNRRSLETALTSLSQSGHVIAFSIDRFNQIRDAIGYRLAARLLGEVGSQMATSAPEAAIGRLSADTIGLALPESDEINVRLLAERLRERIGGSIRLDTVKVDVSLTAGISSVSSGSGDAALDHALIAIEQARGSHRDIATFDAETYGDPARNLSLMSEMIDGINQRKLSLHYQPKLDLRTQQIVGFEALVRWQHPTRGRIAPDVFVTMAEQTGQIHALTEWTLIQAIADQKAMRAAHFHGLVSVNLSGRLIGDDAFTDMALTLIEDTEAELCLEITETAAMHDPEAALRNIDRYVAAGVRISIDDYGAGLSSLSYLKRIRADELKLDKSFVQSLDKDARDALLVRSTIDLAHSLGMKITAEGIETQETLAVLTAMGCDIAQGYLIGRPAPLSEALAQQGFDQRSSTAQAG